MVLCDHASRSMSAHFLESRVHVSLCSDDSVPLRIFRGAESRIMEPAQQLLAGTLGALARLKAYPSFYWISSEPDATGVRSVLGDSANIYGIQAVTADDYNSPVNGLRTVWRALDRDVRTERDWHVVVVAEEEEVACKLTDEFEREVGKIALGRMKMTVKVWGCVLHNRK